MNHTRSTAAASGNPANSANLARNAAALQRVNHRRKVDEMFKDFDKVRPLPKKRDLVFRICTKLDMLSQVEELALYTAAAREGQATDTTDTTRHAGPASGALDAADAYAAGAADGMVEGGQAAAKGEDESEGEGGEGGAHGGQAVSPDMFSIGSRIAGRMEQIMGALHA